MLTLCLLFSLPIMLLFFGIQYLCNIDLTDESLELNDYEQEIGKFIPDIPTQHIYQNDWVTTVVLN